MSFHVLDRYRDKDKRWTWPPLVAIGPVAVDLLHLLRLNIAMVLLQVLRRLRTNISLLVHEIAESCPLWKEVLCFLCVVAGGHQSASLGGECGSLYRCDLQGFTAI